MTTGAATARAIAKRDSADPGERFEQAVEEATVSAAAAHSAGRSRDQWLADRDRTLALAWANRPGDVTWRDLAAAVNAGLPDGAQLSVAALRAAEARGRREAGPKRRTAGGAAG